MLLMKLMHLFEQVLRTFDEHEAKGEDPNKFKWSTLERKLRLGE